MSHSAVVEPTKKDLKTFSLIWALIFFVIAIFPLFSGNGLRIWSLIISAGFLAVAFLKPGILTGFYKVWIKVGEFIGGIISKVILFILFYAMFTPIAFALKLLGKDLLHKKLDKDSSTYWITRESQPGSLKNQF